MSGHSPVLMSNNSTLVPSPMKISPCGLTRHFDNRRIHGGPAIPELGCSGHRPGGSDASRARQHIDVPRLRRHARIVGDDRGLHRRTRCARVRHKEDTQSMVRIRKDHIARGIHSNTSRVGGILRDGAVLQRAPVPNRVQRERCRRACPIRTALAGHGRYQRACSHDIRDRVDVPLGNRPVGRVNSQRRIDRIIPAEIT